MTRRDHPKFTTPSTSAPRPGPPHPPPHLDPGHPIHHKTATAPPLPHKFPHKFPHEYRLDFDFHKNLKIDTQKILRFEHPMPIVMIVVRKMTR